MDDNKKNWDEGPDESYNRTDEQNSQEMMENSVQESSQQPMETVESSSEEPSQNTQEETIESLAEEMESQRLQQEEQPQPASDQQKAEEKQIHYYNETIRNKKKQGATFKRVVAVCAVVSLLGGGGIGVGLGATQYVLGQRGETEQVSTTSSSQTEGNYVQTASSNSSSSNEAVQVIREVSPAVVSITTKVTGTTNYYNFFTVPYEASSAGSGVIFYQDDSKVYIVTNNHVIENANEINVIMDNTDNDIPAEVVGADSDSDLAVLSMDKSDLQAAGITEVTTATFGDSDKLEVGETVIAIGNALGKGKTSTGGMVSALGKEITVEGKTLEVIQTDAAINPGNSGGALVNMNGEVIGINTAKSFETEVEGMGYAIPSNILVPLIEQLLEEGSIPKPYIGIIGQNMTSEVASYYNLLPMGVIVNSVIPGGSAEKAGLQQGDIITEFDGSTVQDMDDLVEKISSKEIGDVVEVKVIRNAETTMTFQLEIANQNA